MDAILHYMTQEKRASIGHEPEKAYNAQEQAVANELEDFKEAIPLGAAQEG